MKAEEILRLAHLPAILSELDTITQRRRKLLQWVVCEGVKREDVKAMKEDLER